METFEMQAKRLMRERGGNIKFPDALQIIWNRAMGYEDSYIPSFDEGDDE